MRLLNVHTRQLATFYNNVPRYAILSHTWDEFEITLQRLQKINGNIPATATEMDELQNSEAFSKITECCNRAIEDDLQWVWVDTCCIDKTDSVELSEAINSMFKWYQESRVCYAFLIDVPGPRHSSFLTSRWFTRGWTLQELLAPKKVVFYGQGWTKLGDRESLVDVISYITRIPTGCLSYNLYRQQTSIAQKMSWASSRETTRTEDMAYCLLGLFGVSMPLLYGEGDKAFLRLQEELVIAENDDSLLVWEKPSHDCWPRQIYSPARSRYAGRRETTKPRPLESVIHSQGSTT
ncbi:heterokaryon incompatibility protein-domain-containing protein [Xylaria longipes]|nr:heterokaryon incompatibility protein-domain-containing protein [Xylaria longipes]